MFPPEPPSCLSGIHALEVGCHSKHYARDVVYGNIIRPHEGLEQLFRGLEDEVSFIGLYGRGPANSPKRHSFEQMPPDYLLIAVTARELAGDDVLDSCRAAAAGGATAIQIRLKHASASDLCRVTERAMAVLDVPIYVNDRLDVALACGAAGVHLGADDLPPDRLQAVLPAELRVGLSVGDPVEAAEAATVHAHYWSLGPFYRTHTKADAGPALEADGFSRLLSHVPKGLPAIAIGGIDERNVPAVIGAGARGVAVVSAIFGAADIEAATRGIRNAIDACMR